MNLKENMTKGATYTLGLAMLLATVAPSRAQTPDAQQLAVSHAVQNQANTIALRQKLDEARATAARGDLAGAAKLYEDAYDMTQQIGSGIDVETERTLSGLSKTRLALARQAQSRGDLREADVQVSRVLKVDPKNAEALAFKKQNDEMTKAMKGKMPDAATMEKLSSVDNEKTQAGTLVQDGVVLYEAGKLEEAEAKLTAALKLDPANEGAFYYLQLIKQAGYKREEHVHITQSQDAMVKVQSAFNTGNRLSLPVPALRPSPLPLTRLCSSNNRRECSPVQPWLPQHLLPATAPAAATPVSRLA